MKKKISFLILLLIFSSFFIFHKKSVDGASSKVIDPEEKYGFKISIISYDGNGNPKVKGKPILVYEKGLLDDKYELVHGNYPTASGEVGYQQFINGSYDVSQFVKIGANVASINQNSAASDADRIELENKNNHKQDVSAKTKRNAEINAEGKSGRTVEIARRILGEITNTELILSLGNADSYVDIEGAFDQRRLNRAYDAVKTANDAVIAAKAALDNPQPGQDSATLEKNLQIAESNLANYTDAFMARYGDLQLTNEQKAATEMIDGLDNIYYELDAISASGCPNKVKSKSSGEANSTYKTFRYNSSASKTLFSREQIANLNDFYKIYEEETIGTAEAVAKKYALSSVEIKKYFGLDINPMEIKNIYVQVEVVQRKLEYDQSKYIIVGSFISASYQHTEIEPTKWTASSENWKDVYSCPNGTYHHEDNIQSVTCGQGPIVCYNLGSVTTVSYKEDCPDGYIHSGGSYPDKYCRPKINVVPETNYCVTDCHAGVIRKYYIYGSISIAPSYIVTTRGNESSLKFNFSDKARTSCLDNKHAILDNNNKETGKNEYYVGPNIENALVGPKTTNQAIPSLKNKTYNYTLKDATWKDDGYYCDSKASKDLGIQHFYFLEYYVCKNECSKVSSDKSSDEYLNCVEQYAENSVDVDLYSTRGNARKKKQEVIFEQCGYTYGQSPKTGSKTSKDRESKNSCNNSASNILKGVAFDYNQQARNINSNSTCNTSNGNLVQWVKGTNIISCRGDQITDFDGNDANNEPKAFDQRSYINVVCKDTTGFEFKDTSQIGLTKGGGFTYPVKQEGERECTYFFNLEQWKVDYAVSPARTGKFKSDERSRLECVLSRFNASITGENVDCKLSDNSDILLYGNTEFETQLFNYRDTSVTAKVDEQLKTSDKNKKESLNLKLTKQNETFPRLQVIGNESIIQVADGKIKKGKDALKVNRYISVDEGNTLYELDKVCISTDGLANISKAPESGICSQTKRNNNTIDILGERKYYTSFQIDESKNSNIYTSVSVGKDSNKYYSDNESCTYKVSPYSCTLTVRNTDGKKLGNGQYLTNELIVDLHHQIDNKIISSIAIMNNGEKNNSTSISIKNKSTNSVEVHNLEGKITLKSGEVVSCSLSVEINTPTACPVKCEIERVNDKLYKIKKTDSSKTPNDFYIYTSNHITPTMDEIRSSNIYPFMKKVVGSVTDGERYIRLSSPLKEGESLYGLVTYSASSCNNICQYIPIPDFEEKKTDCTKEYDPFDLDGIRTYCSNEKNLETDVNNFRDSDFCFDTCSRTKGCPNECSNEKVVANYCENAEKLGFTGNNPKAQCINKCTCKSELGDDYGFRSINVYNPFPNSPVSQAPYEKGNRIIGKNWIAFSEYITDDSLDTTSVTGDNKNTKVEYIIDLSPGDIRMVRDEIRGKFDNSAATQNKRKIYAQLTRENTSSNKIIEAYKSEFLNSRFSYLFKNRHAGIEATFKPNS